MNIRYYLDFETGVPHIYGHDVSELEIEEVLTHPVEDYPGREGSRVALGPISTGRILRVIYVPDPQPNSVFVITAYELRGKPLLAYRRRRSPETDMSKPSRFPPGWDEDRVRRVLEHYESQSEDDAVAEDEAALASSVAIAGKRRAGQTDSGDS